MTEPLLGCDPKEVSPARAGAAFAEFAKQMATEQNMDLTAAWSRAKKLKPELAARMCERDPVADAQPGALANDAAMPVPPAAKAFIAAAFHLPQNVDSEVLNQAWRANGSQYVRVDAKKSFLAICTYIMKKQGLSAAAARRQAQEDFPELARYAGEQLPQP
jgi:hypothetical protein